MSLLTVEKVTHGFGARQILEDTSFRLLKGEHIGLIGANGLRYKLKNLSSISLR